MAIKNNGNKNVKVSQVYWDEAHNYGRHETLKDDPKESRGLSVQLMKGWWATAPIIVVTLTEAEKVEAVKRLEMYHAKLKAATVDLDYNVDGMVNKLSPAEHLFAWEQAYINKGKIITPDYEAVFGFQRSDALTGALALRYKFQLKDEFILPIIVKEYEHPWERVSDCIMENTGKTAGAKLTDNHGPSLMRQGFALLDAVRKEGKGLKEIDTIRVISGGAALKRGTGQKVHYLCVLDARFPKLDLRKRLFDAEKGQEFWRSLDRNKLLELEKGTRTPLPEKAKLATEEEIEGYLADPKSDSVTANIMAKKTDIEGTVNLTSVKLAKYVIGAILNNNLGALNALEPFSDELNKAFDLTGLGAAPKAKSSKDSLVAITPDEAPEIQ